MRDTETLKNFLEFIDLMSEHYFYKINKVSINRDENYKLF